MSTLKAKKTVKPPEDLSAQLRAHISANCARPGQRISVTFIIPNQNYYRVNWWNTTLHNYIERSAVWYAAKNNKTDKLEAYCVREEGSTKNQEASANA